MLAATNKDCKAFLVSARRLGSVVYCVFKPFFVCASAVKALLRA